VWANDELPIRALALTQFKTIEFVFTIMGHSYMPNYRYFAIIEKTEKREDVIVTPVDWTSAF